MASGSVTIIDLATRLGLSKTTVADALRGSGRVSETTRRRVREAALEVNYAANRAARQLRTSKAEALALYIPPDVRDMSFYMPFAFGAADGAARNDYDLTLIAQRAGSNTSWSSFDGVIVIDAPPGDPVLAALNNLSIPIVTAGHLVGLRSDRVAATIQIEHEHMCVEVLDELKCRGATSPAFIAPPAGPPDSWSDQTRKGYLAWCAANGVEPRMVTLPIFPSVDELDTALDAVTAGDAPDAILFGWHDVANRGEVELERKGFRPGTDLLLGALASSEESLRSAYLTVVDLRPREFGAAAAELLNEVVQDPPAETIQRVHRTKLITARGGGL